MGNQQSKKPGPKGSNRSLPEDFASEYVTINRPSISSINASKLQHQGSNDDNNNNNEDSVVDNNKDNTQDNNFSDKDMTQETVKSGTNNGSSPASLLSSLSPATSPCARDVNPTQVDASVASGTILLSHTHDSSEKRLSSLISGDMIQSPPQAHTHSGVHHHHHHNIQPFHHYAPQSSQLNSSTALTNSHSNSNLATPASAIAESAHVLGSEIVKDDASSSKTKQQHYDHIKNNIFGNGSDSHDNNSSNSNHSNDDNYETPVNGHDDHQQGHQHSLSSSNSKETLAEHLDDSDQQNIEPSSPPPPEPNIPFAVLEPGEPILVKKRNNLPQLTIPSASLTRSPPQSPKSGSLSRSLELSPTARLPFLGSVIDKNKSIDLDDMISRLLDAGYSGKVSKSICLKNSEIVYICQTAREVFLSQPALIELNAPVKIVGDIHGQYIDLLRMFEMCGFPPSANFLFLGDYVDRGKQSLETILLLFCYKIKYPENFFLLRGNHECANVTKVYGFYDECKRRASIKMWKAFVDVFNCLPLAAIVANKIFCVHGGLSPSLGTMDDIRALQRPADVPDYGLLNDLLWSDPSDTAFDWEDNERGVSYCFGRSIIQKFLNKHDFDLVCRAHMVVEDGYEFFNDRTLVTVFSAPNYCGEFDNFGAVMSVSEELLCSFELLKPIDQATALAQMQSLAATNGGWRVNKQRLRYVKYKSEILA
ncbi:hypothetical protein BGZ76_005573 [Entomortierella beljakovae]|nr:hypothetical protein BGZ76_005573 [Entomortierella beljakovae]